MRSPSAPLRRLTLAAGVVGATALAPATPAAAASLQLGVPAEAVSASAFPITVTGSFETAAYVEVKLRLAGAPCAPTAAADPGTPVLDRSATTAALSLRGDATAGAPGAYVVCGWAKDTTAPGAPVVAAASAPVNVRAPRATVAIAAPPSVVVDELFTLAVTATSEVASSVYAGVVPDLGKGCPATYDALQKTARSVPVLAQSGVPIAGPATVKEASSLPTKGKYLACGYVHRGAIAVAPEGASTTAFTAGAACVVPVLKGNTLARARKLLTKAGCRLGKAKQAKSAAVKKGRVVRTGKKAGTTLPPNTAIGVIVSKGR